MMIRQHWLVKTKPETRLSDSPEMPSKSHYGIKKKYLMEFSTD